VALAAINIFRPVDEVVDHQRDGDSDAVCWIMRT